MEQRLAQRPKIAAPSILLYGATDPLARPAPDLTPAERAVFPALVARRVIPGAGGQIDRAIQMSVALVPVELESKGFTHALSYRVFIRTCKRPWRKVSVYLFASLVLPFRVLLALVFACDEFLVLRVFN